MRLLPTVLIVSAALTLTGCAAPAPSAGPETTPAGSTPTATPTPAPPRADGTRHAPYPYGTVVHIADDSIWDFTIHTPQADPNAWVAAADEFNDAPVEPNTWVGANIAVTVRDIPELAKATDAMALTFSLNPVFVGSSGTVYDFWTVNYPAMFNGESWNSLPDVFLSAGQQWDKPFALQVPATEVGGGSFAVRHEVSGDIIFFGG